MKKFNSNFFGNLRVKSLKKFNGYCIYLNVGKLLRKGLVVVVMCYRKYLTFKILERIWFYIIGERDFIERSFLIEFFVNDKNEIYNIYILLFFNYSCFIIIFYGYI